MRALTAFAPTPRGSRSGSPQQPARATLTTVRFRLGKWPGSPSGRASAAHPRVWEDLGSGLLSDRAYGANGGRDFAAGLAGIGGSKTSPDARFRTRPVAYTPPVSPTRPQIGSVHTSPDLGIGSSPANWMAQAGASVLNSGSGPVSGTYLDTPAACGTNAIPATLPSPDVETWHASSTAFAASDGADAETGSRAGTAGDRTAPDVANPGVAGTQPEVAELEEPEEHAAIATVSAPRSTALSSLTARGRCPHAGSRCRPTCPASSRPAGRLRA